MRQWCKSKGGECGVNIPAAQKSAPERQILPDRQRRLDGVKVPYEVGALANFQIITICPIEC